MTANTQPIYMQYTDVPAPERFVTTVEAYTEAIRQDIPDWSARKMLAEAGLSHGLLHALRSNPGRQPDLKSIGKIVGTLNQHLSSDQRWPVESAVIAAGYPASNTARIQPPTLINQRQAPTPLDLMPRVSASLALPVFDFALLNESGLERAQISRKHFNASTDMGILKGRVPGYPLQRSPDEWVIFLRPEAERSVPNDAYALVRTEAREVRAFPRHLYTKSQVIGWLIGVIYLPSMAAEESVSDVR